MRHGDEAPLDLGVVGAVDQLEPAEAPSREGSGRWRWAFLALAFVAGGVLGLVVADSRDDAAAYADVRLVSGMVMSSYGQADEVLPSQIEVTVLNLGEHEVEILGLQPHGTTVEPGAEEEEPLTAPPGEWVTARQDGLIVDCDAEVDAEDGVQIRVRDAGGTERVVEADGMPEYGGVSDALRYGCESAAEIYPDIGAMVTASDAESITIDVRLSNPGTEPMEVSALETDTPGVAAAAGADLPFELPPGESVGVPLTWTVTDCRLARTWPDPQVVYRVGRYDASLGTYPLDAPAQAALVLLTDRVCGDAP
ncbi:hypothetical protein [Jiangella alkaliphila]|uniref:Uncharacterized protein n=1 Tax=Jiangella alkaliphila TaxID=419479 RepID=A0A1H2KR67_9ACTN|nr:hypothetical protein [Jiangella alkaliphila]SDU71034.1 hypothetical protein SAMN04488563_4140 [Jiangella alkaliphila]